MIKVEQMELQKLGLAVIRFSNNQVNNEVDQVINEILSFLRNEII